MRINNFILFGFVLFGIAGCDEFFTKNVVFGGNARIATGSSSSSGSGGGGTDAPTDDDADGLSNEIEQTFGLDPRSADSDHDGFDDGLEFVGRSGDPLNSRSSPTPFDRERILSGTSVRRSESDTDRDGLGSKEEADLGTDASSPDSDEDGYSDGLEAVAGSDPLSSTSRPVRISPPVSDGGGQVGVAPRDGDGDGLSDEVEGLNGGKVDSQDSDGDGYSDGVEFLMGSEASNAESVPNFQTATSTILQ